MNEAMEDRLWKYAQGEMDAEEAQSFEGELLRDQSLKAQWETLEWMGRCGALDARFCGAVTFASISAESIGFVLSGAGVI